jgi:hypothetical protein
MSEVFGGDAQRLHLLLSMTKERLSTQLIFTKGDTAMGDSGKKDKGKRETQKKAQLDPKAKRKLKQEKKHKSSSISSR